MIDQCFFCKAKHTKFHSVGEWICNIDICLVCWNSLTADKTFDAELKLQEQLYLTIIEERNDNETK